MLLTSRILCYPVVQEVTRPSKYHHKILWEKSILHSILAYWGSPCRWTLVHFGRVPGTLLTPRFALTQLTLQLSVYSFCFYLFVFCLSNFFVFFPTFRIFNFSAYASNSNNDSYVSECNGCKNNQWRFSSGWREAALVNTWPRKENINSEVPGL